MSSTDPAAFTGDQADQNDQRIADLIELIRSGEAIAMVGAGSSISAGYDSWIGLLKKLVLEAQRFDISFVADPDVDPLECAQRIRDSLVERRGLEYYQARVAWHFNRDPTLTPFHHQLVRLPFRALLTTNYEYTLEKALEAAGCVPPPTGVAVWNGIVPLARRAVRAIAVGGPIRYVIHLHGVYDQPASVVLCASDYAQAYGLRRDGGTGALSPDRSGSTWLLTLVTALLTTRRLVFVGFSLTDLYFDQVLERVSTTMWEWGEAVHYAIMPIEAARAREQRVRAAELKDRLGIETVFYDATNDPRHTQLDVLIERISRAVAPPTASLPDTEIVTPPATPDSVPPPMPAWVNTVNAAAGGRIESRED